MVLNLIRIMRLVFYQEPEKQITEGLTKPFNENCNGINVLIPFSFADS
jgi:hypothetical protein